MNNGRLERAIYMPRKISPVVRFCRISTHSRTYSVVMFGDDPKSDARVLMRIPFAKRIAEHTALVKLVTVLKTISITTYKRSAAFVQLFSKVSI
jgi:hypothetical protein